MKDAREENQPNEVNTKSDDEYERYLYEDANALS